MACRAAPPARSLFCACAEGAERGCGDNEMKLVPTPPRSRYTELCANVIFPLHEMLKRHDTTSRRRALEQSEWWGRERLERHQLESLRAFLSRVGSTVPYYQALFRSS